MRSEEENPLVGGSASDTEAVKDPFAKQAGDASTRRRHICCVVVVVALILLAIVARPRKPVWETTSVQITGMKVDPISGIVESAVNVNVSAIIRARNPNLVGAYVEPGAFKIEYVGEEPWDSGRKVIVGTSTSSKIFIMPYGVADIVAEAKIDSVNDFLGLEMLTALLKQSDSLPFSVEGDAVSWVAFLRVKTHVDCKIVEDLSQFPSFSTLSQDCTYTSKVGGMGQILLE